MTLTMTTAAPTKAKDLIEKLEQEVDKNGIVKDEVIQKLTELRELYIESKDPLVTRVIRLTAEYIEENETFDIDLLSVDDEEVEEDEDESTEGPTLEDSEAVFIDMDAEDSFNQIKENFKYLLELFRNNNNKMNREELQRIKFAYINMGMA